MSLNANVRKMAVAAATSFISYPKHSFIHQVGNSPCATTDASSDGIPTKAMQRKGQSGIHTTHEIAEPSADMRGNGPHIGQSAGENIGNSWTIGDRLGRNAQSFGPDTSNANNNNLHSSWSCWIPRISVVAIIVALTQRCASQRGGLSSSPSQQYFVILLMSFANGVTATPSETATALMLKARETADSKTSDPGANSFRDWLLTLVAPLLLFASIRAHDGALKDHRRVLWGVWSTLIMSTSIASRLGLGSSPLQDGFAIFGNMALFYWTYVLMPGMLVERLRLCIFLLLGIFLDASVCFAATWITGQAWNKYTDLWLPAFWLDVVVVYGVTLRRFSFREADTPYKEDDKNQPGPMPLEEVVDHALHKPGPHKEYTGRLGSDTATPASLSVRRPLSKSVKRPESSQAPAQSVAGGSRSSAPATAATRLPPIVGHTTPDKGDALSESFAIGSSSDSSADERTK